MIKGLRTKGLHMNIFSLRPGQSGLARLGAAFAAMAQGAGAAPLALLSMLMTSLAAIVMTMAMTMGAATPVRAFTLEGVGEFSFERIARGVHVMHGPMGAPSRANKGFMNNPAIIETANGLALIDPGGSSLVGSMVIKEIAKVSSKPVLAVFNTHIHGDHWLANDAIAKAWPKAAIYGHPTMIKRANGDDGLAWLEEMERLTEGASRGTKILAPQKEARAKDVIAIDGEKFIIHRLGSAHTNSDIMIEHVASKTLFLGDNCFAGRLGQFEESASMHGNIDTLKYALGLKMAHYVPGHGRSGDGEKVIRPFLDYLELMRDEVTKGYRAEKADYEISKEIRSKFAHFAGWAGFDFNFGKHVSKMFLEVEEREF
jgi:glyoxylase-like metal-dependent hydrolase (beta-lactamase superfamily II)